MWLALALLTLPNSAFSELVVPVTPCPNVFNYQYKSGSKSEVIGVMVFKNDLSGRYKVEMNMTVAAYVDKNIAIKRMTTSARIQNGEDLMYQIIFPTATAIPEVLSIVFNEVICCSGLPKPGEQTYGYTTLHAFDFFSTQITTRNTFVTAPINNIPQSLIITKPEASRTKITTITDYWVSVITPGTTVAHKNSTVPPRRKSTTISYTQTTKPITHPPPILTEIVNRLKEEIQCGVAEDTQPLLVHGKPTSEGQYPWLIAMFHLNEETAEYKFKCAGSLVSPKHIITAAHCVRVEKNTLISKDNVILVLGKHNIHSWAVRSEIRDVKKIYVHPDYTHPSDADIAIVIMYKTVEYTSKIKPLCLWTEDDNVDSIVGSNGVVVGWGRDEYEAVFVPEPRQLTMPIVSQEDCLRADERFLKLTSHRTFCAGSRKGEGPCTGDSGGGFIMKRKGQWTLRGIVSSALVDPKTHSCDVHNYMVFADVTKYMPWIKHILAK